MFYKHNLFWHIRLIILVVCATLIVGCATVQPDVTLETDETITDNSPLASSEISELTESKLIENFTPSQAVKEDTVIGDNTCEETVSSDSTSHDEITPTETISPVETEPHVTYQDVNETVYAMSVVNIRLGPGIDYDKIGQLQTNEPIHRNGIGDNGWSRVVYNNQEAYISSNYLMTQKPVITEPNISQKFVPKGSYAVPDFSIYNEYEKSILQTVLSKINENKDNPDIHEELIQFEQEISFESYYKIASFFYAYYGQKRAVDETFDFIRSSDVDENGNRIFYIRLRYDDIRQFENDMIAVRNKVDSILMNLNDGDDEYVLKQIAEYLRTHITYTYGKYSVHNALLDGQSVCNGYALAFNMLANRAGIKSDLCVGQTYSGEYHAWNRVIVNGNQYFYDITWYDSNNGPDNKYIHSSTNFHGSYLINDYNACWNG